MAMIVRGRFTLKPDEPAELVKKPLLMPELEEEHHDAAADEMVEAAEYQLGQGPLDAELYDEEDSERTGELLYGGDFAEHKLNAEVILRAACHPPGGRRATSCPVEVSLGDWTKRLLVTGPRVWVDKVLGGKATDAVAFATMPIDWAHAFGGEPVPENPVGKGAATEELPNVTYPEDVVTRSGQKIRPASFAPINPTWPQRAVRLGKNYGEEYQRTREPWYSDDYDWRYQHAAPDDQQLKGYLRGDESIRFKALHPESSDFSKALPGIRPRAFVMKSGEIVEIPLVLDTLYADLIDGEMRLTWRGLTPVAEDDLADVEFILLVQELLSEPKRGAREYHEILQRFADDPVGFEDSPAAALLELEKDLDSGALEAEIDAMPPDVDAASAFSGKLVSRLAPGVGAGPGVDALAKSEKQISKAAPGTQDKIRQALKDALRDARTRSGAAAPMRPGAGINAGLAPLLKRAVKAVGKAQKAAGSAGAAFIDVAERLQDKLDELDLPDREALTEEAANRPPDEPGPDCNLAGEDLTGRDFSGMDLSRANLEGSVLCRAKLVGTKLVGANLLGANLASADLSGADCTEADLSGAQLAKTIAVGTNLTSAKLDNSFHTGVDFTDANLSGATGFSTISMKSIYAGVNATGAAFEFCCFDNADFSRADLSEANLTRTLFRQCNLQRSKLDGADMSKGGFVESDVSGASLLKTKAECTNWMKSKLTECDFSYSAMPDNMFMSVDARSAKFFAINAPNIRFYKASLRDATFEKANLKQADMRKSSLAGARFNGANAYQAVFMEAYGNDVDFREANAKGANFRRNKMVTKT